MDGTTVRLWTIKTPIWITLCTSVYCFIFWYYHKIMSSFIHFFQLFFLPVQFVDKLWFKFTFLQVYKWLIFYKFKWRKYVDPFFILPDFLKFCRTCKWHVHYILRDYTVYFSSACTAAEGVPTLTTHPLACHLDSSCMAVDCCIRVSDITRNLHVKLTLDPCAFTMTLQMERYQVEVDLLTYNFGKLNFY